MSAKPQPSPAKTSVATRLPELLVGQPEAIATILPFIQTHKAGLSPEGRPIGVILLLGPTGTGKTKTIEGLAQALHGSDRSFLKIDCGEFQADHEVSKLIGAPPGYIGHQETQPRLTQSKVNAVASNESDICLVLFDEIEKAAPGMMRILLGILDKATLHTGSNQAVNFERCLIFMTSNLGAKAIQSASNPTFGFEAMSSTGKPASAKNLHNIGMAAVKRKFSPEFVNRIDTVITYRPLDREACGLILDRIVDTFATLIGNRLGIRGFHLRCTKDAKSVLLDKGTSIEYGARELKRTVQRELMQPIAMMVSENQIPPGSTVTLNAKGGEFEIKVA